MLFEIQLNFVVFIKTINTNFVTYYRIKQQIIQNKYDIKVVFLKLKCQKENNSFN